MSTVTSTIEHIGLTPIAKRYGYRASAIQKWRDAGALPQTELSGLTDYASGIAELSGGTVTKEELLKDTRAYWQSRRNGSRKSQHRNYLKARGAR